MPRTGQENNMYQGTGHEKSKHLGTVTGTRVWGRRGQAGSARTEGLACCAPKVASALRVFILSGVTG